jgi:glycosyltransferase involved in cell wall biosynthesis
MLRDKGVEDLAEAAKLVRADPSSVVTAVDFELLGDDDPGNPSSVAGSQLEDLQRQGLLRWTRGVADVRPKLVSANIVCLPSLREGVPMALLEAAACGRALVATDAPGCREAVRHGETGLLVPVRDPRALANALLELAHSPETRARMGLAARARAEREFSKETIADQVAAVYEECLSAGAKGAS